MAITSLNTIKQWFRTGLKPTQSQFWNSWDSFWHKLELIPASAIDGLQALLDLKADKKDIESTVNAAPYVFGQAYVFDALAPQYVSAPDSQGTNWYQLLADASPTDVPGEAPTIWKFIGPTLGDITIADVFGLRQELDDRMLKSNDHYRGAFISKAALDAAIPIGRAGDFARVDPGVATDVKDYIWDVSDNKWVQSSSGGTIVTDAVPTLGSTNAVQSGGTKTELNRIEGIAKKFSQKFSFSSISSFKQAYDRPISITSVIKAATITDLRAGKNGATPTTMVYPYTIAANDVITFAATYDQESDSYFTLIGTYTD